MTWDAVAGFNDNPKLRVDGRRADPTPDGGKTSSRSTRATPHLPGAPGRRLLRVSRRRGHLGPAQQGCDRVFLVADTTVHDPHCVRQHPAMPDRLYMQNHCGIYRLDRPSDTWVRVGRKMPKAVGDIGFPMTVHPRDPETAWVFPMDGSDVWPRVSPGGKPAVYRTRNAGRSWERQDRGLPKEQAWFTDKRQAMCADAGAPVGLYFGTTSGEVWASADEGKSWRCLAAHLPRLLGGIGGRLADEVIVSSALHAYTGGGRRWRPRADADE